MRARLGGQVIGLGLGVLAAGCGSASAPAPAAPPREAATPPACEVVRAHMLQLVVDLALEGATDAEARAVVEKAAEAAMPTLADCATWPATFRTCVHAATTEAALNQCTRTVQIANGIDMAGPTCDRVAAHMTSLAIPASLRDDAAVEHKLRTQFADACLTFPRTTKECMLGLAAIADAPRCRISGAEAGVPAGMAR